MRADEALIFDIQDFATHDGPGVRTLVFFKGCPLHCRWCANPEGQERRLQLMTNSINCVGCLKCGEACENDAITAGDDGRPLIDRQICRTCTEALCIDACPEKALRCAGLVMTVEELFEQVRRNSRLYRNSGGGITLSGGEPLAQPEFVRALLERCSEIGLSVGVETCGAFRWDVVKDFIGRFDFYFFDIKGLDEQKHREATGWGLSTIHDNLRRLAALGPEKVTVSIPVIPGFTDDEKCFPEILEFLGGLSITKMRLLAYHELGRGKYEELGQPYRMGVVDHPSDDVMRNLGRMATTAGFECVV